MNIGKQDRNISNNIKSKKNGKNSITYVISRI